MRLGTGRGEGVRVFDTSGLSVTLGPLRLSHPLLNASGTLDIFETAEALGRSGTELIDHPPMAAYVPKTITLSPRGGNEPPRTLETAGGMLNSIGLPNPGMEKFVGTELPRLLGLPCPVIVNLGGFSPQEYGEGAGTLRTALDETLGEEEWASRVGLELNVSCPNVHSGCMSIGTDPGETADTVGAVRDLWPGLLMVKLTPNTDYLPAVAGAAERSGADALSLVNTYKGLAIDRDTLKPYLGGLTGGLSGPAIKPLALWAIYQAYKEVEIPIVGIGGVVEVQDVLDHMSCGATAVAVGSAGLRDPWLTHKLVVGLAGELESRGITVGELVGCAHV